MIISWRRERERNETTEDVRRLCKFMCFTWDPNQNISMPPVSAYQLRETKSVKKAFSMISLALTNLCKN
jgi:hypothetical protein